MICIVQIENRGMAAGDGRRPTIVVMRSQVSHEDNDFSRPLPAHSDGIYTYITDRQSGCMHKNITLTWG